jgi:DNA polymerase III delta subunit
LVRAVGHDLGALAQELEKLACVAVGRAATPDDVARLVGVRRGETLQDLVDAGLERRAAAAAQLVQPVLEQAGMTGVRILTALGTALIGTALARAELDGGAPGRRGGPGGRGGRGLESTILGHLRAARPYGLGSWEETATRWARWAVLWSAPELRHALRLALEADRALKSTTVTAERGVLVQLLLSFAVLERAGA